MGQGLIEKIFMKIALPRKLEIDIPLPELIGDGQTIGSSHTFSLGNCCQRTTVNQVVIR